MNEMMSEMREMMEKRIKKIVKKLGEKMGVSEEELMRMLGEEGANGVESLVSIAVVEVKAVAVEKKTRAPPKKKEPELDENGEPKKKARAPPKKKEVELDENGEPVKKVRAPPKKKEVELDENGEPVKKVRAPPKKELDENGEPVKKVRAPPKKKEVELDENGEPVKKVRAPPKKKEVELDENGEPVKKVRAPPKKKEPELDANGEPVKKVRAPPKKKVAEVREEVVVAVPPVVEPPKLNHEVDFGSNDSDADTVLLPESESDGNMLYNSKINVMRVVIKGIAYLYDENMNAYHEASKTFVGKYEPELGQISLLDMDSGSEEEGGSEDECPALSD